MGAALAAFAVVFLAELGDRTQLMVVSLAARHRPAPVFTGMALGYLLTTAAAATLGGVIGAALPERVVLGASAALFLAFALWAWRSAGAEDDDAEEQAAEGRRGLRLVLALTVAVVVSEIGDKSMIATATLAADGNPVAVAVGGFAGIIAAGGLGVAAGRLLADRVRPEVIGRASALLFLGFGIALAVRATTG